MAEQARQGPRNPTLPLVVLVCAHQISKIYPNHCCAGVRLSQNVQETMLLNLRSFYATSGEPVSGQRDGVGELGRTRVGHEAYTSSVPDCDSLEGCVPHMEAGLIRGKKWTRKGSSFRVSEVRCAVSEVAEEIVSPCHFQTSRLEAHKKTYTRQPSHPINSARLVG